MDFSLIAGVLTGITNSLVIARAAIDVRDFNQAGAAIADVTQKLLDLQTQVIASNGAFMQLQEQHSALSQIVRELQEQAADRAGYELFELTAGVLVYRSNVAPQPVGADDPRTPKPMHYLCPRCFDLKTKALLKLIGVHWHCVNCNQTYWTGRQDPPVYYPRNNGF